MPRYRNVALLLIFALIVAAGLAEAKPPADKPGGGPPEGGKKEEPVDHTARQERPIQLGVSGGSVTDLANGYCCSGTLGALVQDSLGTQHVLSNTHVFAGDSVAGGNGVVAEAGDPINQPGYVDVQCQNILDDYVAGLSDWVELAPGGTSLVDAAVAEAVPGAVDAEGRILEIGAISSDTVPAALNMAVKKSGRTSGLTKGKVSALNATVSVQYSNECAGGSFVTTFTGQILVSPGNKFLKPGDSGSLMVEDEKVNPRAVGLLYAGSSRVAVANPIDDVLTALGVSMVGVPASASGTSGDASAPKGLAKASEAKAKNAQRLMQVPGAVGHAVGLSSRGKPGVVVKVLVKEITPQAQSNTPAELDGVPVELMEVGEIVAY
ncbi:MAG TPA: hypothetical protein HPP83_01465 [Candidatus Hydrogenedentes bacterium]|nr:hypothetical protein [Candidatus Hydrogenedentota bacterium]